MLKKQCKCCHGGMKLKNHWQATTRNTMSDHLPVPVDTCKGGLEGWKIKKALQDIRDANLRVVSGKAAHGNRVARVVDRNGTARSRWRSKDCSLATCKVENQLRMHHAAVMWAMMNMRPLNILGDRSPTAHWQPEPQRKRDSDRLRDSLAERFQRREAT